MNLPISKYKIVAVTAFGVLILGSFYKWAIFSRMGIVPKNICSPQVMRNYLKQGGNPNAWRSDFDYSFPIVKCFTEIKDQNLLDWFIEKGGDLNYKFWGGSTIWTELRSPESALILFRGVSKSNKFSASQKQSMTLKLLTKSEDIALFLLQNGANINLRDRKGNTVLHQTLDPDVAKIAINKGVNVNTKNNNGETPLQITKSSSVAQILIDFGANIEFKDNLGNTLLHLNQEPAVSAILIKNGIDPNVKNKQGVTILHNSWKNPKRKDLASTLINSGADINVQDNQGRTPLHTAVIGNTYAYYLKLLIEFGADINLKDNQEKTPFDYARASQKQDLIELLSSYNSSSMNQ
ncbi:MAG: ankyrin repeat domain-containing protein [Cyanobacteria bacterium J06621_8]